MIFRMLFVYGISKIRKQHLFDALLSPMRKIQKDDFFMLSYLYEKDGKARFLLMLF